MSTASNLMKEDYERYIQTTEFFTKMHGDADEPEQVGQKTNCSHSSDIISISSPLLNVQDYLLEAGEGHQGVSSAQTEDLPDGINEESHHSSSQDESENTEVTQPGRRTKAREDNNNNIHKTFITDLNNCLKARSRLKPIQDMLKKQKVKFNKGSRPSFVIRLIDIRHLYGDGILADILDDFRQIIQEHLKLPENSTPADLLLKNLVPVYEDASHIFATGDVVRTVIRIYTIEKAKEKLYMKKGIKKVEDYLAKRS